MKKNIKCIGSLLLTAAILLTSLTCCSSEKTNNNNSSAASATVSNISLTKTDPLMGEGKKGQIKLKVWAPDAAVSLCIQQCKKFSEDMKSYGDIKISVVPQGEADSANKALTDAESAADVYGFACDNLDKLVKAGVLMKISGENRKKPKQKTVKIQFWLQNITVNFMHIRKPATTATALYTIKPLYRMRMPKP